MRLLQVLLARGHLTAGAAGYELTAPGLSWLAEIGIAFAPQKAGARYAYPCLDWSERRDHLAGPLATSLLEHFLARRWLARRPQSRALELTPQGKRALSSLL